jgi:hypothetical protein
MTIEENAIDQSAPKSYKLLHELLEIACMHEHGIDDPDLLKINNASDALVDHLNGNPKDLIQAILVGVQGNLQIEFPIIEIAKEKLKGQWPTMGRVFKETPNNLLRLMLFNAAIETSQGDEQLAAILWLAVADVIPYVNIGSEKDVIKRELLDLAKRTEQLALLSEVSIDIDAPESTPIKVKAYKAYKVNKDELLKNVAAASGPSSTVADISGRKVNSVWSNSTATWSYEFTTLMTSALEIEFNALSTEITNNLKDLGATFESFSIGLNKNLIQELNQIALHIQSEQSKRSIKLDVLWWYEALYSSSMMCSYRELNEHLNYVVMPFDLLEITKISPLPASIVYVLAEALNRLPKSGFLEKSPLIDILEKLNADKASYPSALINRLAITPENGCLLLRDVIALILTGNSDIPSHLKRAGLDGQTLISFPDIAKSIFRQEQASRLSEELYE